MKTYTLKQAIKLNLLPWSVKTIMRMRERGDINLINIGNGSRNRWAITDAEVQRVVNAYKKSTNKMVDGRDLNQG